MEPIFVPAHILLPQVADMTKWSVVACDQYTSQPDYWERVEAFVGDAPSALHLMLPEIYLEAEDVDTRIADIRTAMESYLQSGVLTACGQAYIYVERTLDNGRTRRGLVGAVDLEAYDYNAGSTSPVRATEGTILSRIPPRVRVRSGAKLEMPHIMLLIDDPADCVIGPVAGQAQSFKQAYDFDLMEQGGHLSGWFVTGDASSQVMKRLDSLVGQSPLAFAVGDGNHSLATAKACYEQLKTELGAQAAQSHPARWALCEVVNLHDASLQFEPIHRAVFDVDAAALLHALQTGLGLAEGQTGGQTVTVVTADGETAYAITKPCAKLAVGSVQKVLDGYLEANGGRVDYIHGADTVRNLAKNGAVGLLLPAMDKSELFPSVLSDGALPRKTFSMGEANEKRFYLETRRIQ